MLQTELKAHFLTATLAAYKRETHRQADVSF